MPIKTFRGLLGDNHEEKIHLSTRDGRTGYRIVKFEIMSNNPGTTDYEHVVKVHTVTQDTTDAAAMAAINFSEPTLIGAAFIEGNNSTNYIDMPSQQVVFDHVIFNQDIFVTHIDVKAALSCNYYLELEQMRIDSDESAVATLKNMRTTSTQTAG